MTTPVERRHRYIHSVMEMALTLASIASFFVLVLSWTILPASGTERSSAVAPAAAPSAQAAS